MCRGSRSPFTTDAPVNGYQPSAKSLFPEDSSCKSLRLNILPFLRSMSRPQVLYNEDFMGSGKKARQHPLQPCRPASARPFLIISKQTFTSPNVSQRGR